jgi:RimJ/RimL family protein N-acetyltransferase
MIQYSNTYFCDMNTQDSIPHPYLFTSERLGFRNWREDDLALFAEMNADHEVMEYFPSVLTVSESAAFIQRLQMRYDRDGYTYYAVDEISTGSFIGFIGLAYQDYPTTFNPAVDLGWRLMRSAWGMGYATEGARRCMAYAFDELGMDRLIAVCTYDNLKSEHVMQKIGMRYMGTFDHPNLTEHPEYLRCKWYEITSTP